MKRIGVLGRGTMASGIIQVLAQNEYDVVMWVRNIDEANPRGSLKSVDKNLGRMVKKEKMTEEDKQKVLSRIEITTKFEDLKDCDLVIEAISEDMKVKKDTFKKLDEICKSEAILASNTSSLSITDVASATNRPEKVIGMHFFNPVPVMKLVEVIKGIATSEETRNTIFELAEKLGKTPVEVEEAPGFVVLNCISIFSICIGKMFSLGWFVLGGAVGALLGFIFTRRKFEKEIGRAHV